MEEEKIDEFLERMQELREDLRSHAEDVTDAKCAALCETSAEVMQGLETAFEHYLAKSEKAWR